MGALALGCKIRVITDHKPLSYLDSLFARRNDDEDDNDGSINQSISLIADLRPEGRIANEMQLK